MATVKKIIFICFATIALLITSIKLFSYSKDLGRDIFEPSLPAYYSDKYLEDVGFKSYWGCGWDYRLSKRDLFKVRLSDKLFQDTLDIGIHTSNEIYPMYGFYSIWIDNENNDNKFKDFFGFNADSTVIDTTTISVQYRTEEFYQNYDEQYDIERIAYFMDDTLHSVKYYIEPKQSCIEAIRQMNSLERYFLMAKLLILRL